MPKKPNYSDLDAQSLAELRTIAAFHGYTIGRGRDALMGSRKQLEMAIISGEMALVLLDDGPRSAFIRWANTVDMTTLDPSLAEAIRDIASSLADAVTRTRAHD